MKAILEFQLPEDQEDLNIALNADNYKYILLVLDDFLRTKIDCVPDDQAAKAYEEVRTELYQLLADDNIRL